ncbi:MAG: hypothetical protein IJC17_04515 [Clostridia bacterium]|nr:hypothetical protein [Clostridia bacterium]
MKRLLLDGNKPYYKANLHCHTVNSDGDYTPEEIKALYKEQGYAVVAFTDHEHILDNNALTDESFLAITACEIAIREFPDGSTRTHPMMRVCHLNLLGKDPHRLLTPCYSKKLDHFLNDNIVDKVQFDRDDYERVYSGEGISEIIRIANESGFLVTYNHPRWSLENARQYLGYKGLWAVEIYNHACNEMGLYEYDINVYDDFLRDGQRLACVAADDAHVARDLFGGFVMINADRLDYATIMQALENHDFYASTGPVIRELSLEENVATVTFEKGVYATMSSNDRRGKKAVADDPMGENTVSFEIPAGTEYVRFDVVGADGTRANTCAYFLDEVLK